MAPGFEYEDMEIAARDGLKTRYSPIPGNYREIYKDAKFSARRIFLHVRIQDALSGLRRKYRPTGPDLRLI